MKKLLHQDNGKSTEAVYGNERTKQESRIDEFPLREGPVDDFQHPSHETINSEKHDVIKETYRIIQYDVLHKRSCNVKSDSENHRLSRDAIPMIIFVPELNLKNFYHNYAPLQRVYHHCGTLSLIFL